MVAASGHAQAAGTRAGAVELGLRLLGGLRQWSGTLAQSEPEPTLAEGGTAYAVNLGQIHAGDWTSTTPSRAILSVRIGYPRAWTPEQAEERVRRVVAELAAGDEDFPAQPTLTLTGFRAKGYLLDEGSALVRDLSAAHLDAHGVRPRTFTLGSTTDARTYVNDFGIPALCFGATGHDLHGTDESVELQSIIDARLHLAMAQATHNGLLVGMSLDLRTRISLSLGTEPYTDAARRIAIVQHQARVAAVAERRAHDAAAIAVPHVAVSETLIRDVAARAGGSPADPQVVDPRAREAP